MEQNGFHQPENQFPPAGISSIFKNQFPLMTVSASRKKLSSKITVSVREKSFSNCRNEGFVRKYVSTRQKKSFFGQESLKKYKKWFVLALKFVSTTRNEAFFEKYVSTIRKNCFFWQENQRKWFPLAGVYFSFKTGSP